MKYLKQFFILSLPAFLLLLSLSIFSQTTKTGKINKSVPQTQKDTTKEAGTYTALVYISDDGRQNVRSITCFSADLNELMKMIDSASKGSVVIFDYLKFVSSKGVTTEIKEIPYNFKRLGNKGLIKSQAALEVEKLQSLKFISGTIYFSGFGFTNVLSAKASDSSTLYRYYARSGPGTTITLDNCILKNVNGSLSTPVSKSVKLQ